ncbi:MAG: hypothetical protein IK149_00090 [Oscillospiraceae bacterium]|nr:hypothetical protein [Oscillospiraceae bacterium]
MKKHSFLFLFLCLALCLAPLAGMLFYPTTVSTDNRPLADFPSLTDRNGGVNLSFFQEAEDCFNDRFAFRNELIYADAMLMGKVFHVSSVDSVVYGKEGWLYYASTLDDFLGLAPMSERELNNLAHNLSLISRYVESRGARFLFCVPPNKNTLYSEFMPDWADGIVEETHNIERLTPLLDEYGVPYADLLALFRSQDEILYLKRDSHWNNKGAALAADLLLDSLAVTHEACVSAPATRIRDDDGDLNRMLYTLYGEKSINYHYEIPVRYTFVGENAGVEDGRLDSLSDSGNGTLLMFRDSFANTLIPLLANDFERACFCKEVPCSLEAYMDELRPQYVVAEKVERNIAEYLSLPPVLSAPEITLAGTEERIDAEAGIHVAPCDYDAAYLTLSGTVDASLLGAKTEILVRVGGTVYEAYQTGENGFLLYLKKDALRLPAQIEVLLRDGEGLRALRPQEVSEQG